MSYFSVCLPVLVLLRVELAAVHVVLGRPAELNCVAHDRLIALLADTVVDASGGNGEAARLRDLESDDDVLTLVGPDPEAGELWATVRLVALSDADTGPTRVKGIHADHAHAIRYVQELDSLDRRHLVPSVREGR